MEAVELEYPQVQQSPSTPDGTSIAQCLAHQSESSVMEENGLVEKSNYRVVSITDVAALLPEKSQSNTTLMMSEVPGAEDLSSRLKR